MTLIITLFKVLGSLKHEWTLESVVDEDWARKLESIESEETKKNAKNTVNEFSKILSRNLNLRVGVTHHDLNSLNIIGEEIAGKGENLKNLFSLSRTILMLIKCLVELRGIIDFGDVCKSRFVFDLAICIIYMMVAVIVQDPKGLLL